MPFHGIVSRFAQGAPTSPTPPAVTTALVGRGMSPAGAAQLLAGEAIAAAGDRRAAAGAVAAALDLAAAPGAVPIGLLLPAVQKIREAAARTSAPGDPQLVAWHEAGLRQIGVSALGVRQFAAAFPVGRAEDRALIAALLRDAAAQGLVRPRGVAVVDRPGARHAAGHGSADGQYTLTGVRHSAP